MRCQALCPRLSSADPTARIEHSAAIVDETVRRIMPLLLEGLGTWIDANTCRRVLPGLPSALAFQRIVKNLRRIKVLKG